MQLNDKLLEDPEAFLNFITVTDKNLASLEATADPDCIDVELLWQALKSSILDACSETIGYAKRKHQEWFDENDVQIQEIISQKRIAHLQWKDDPISRIKEGRYHQPKVKGQNRLRSMQAKS